MESSITLLSKPVSRCSVGDTKKRWEGVVSLIMYVVENTSALACVIILLLAEVILVCWCDACGVEMICRGENKGCLVWYESDEV